MAVVQWCVAPLSLLNHYDSSPSEKANFPSIRSMVIRTAKLARQEFKLHQLICNHFDGSEYTGKSTATCATAECLLLFSRVINGGVF